MYKARIDFFTGEQHFRAGDIVPGTLFRLRELLKKQIVVEVKIVLPEKRKRGRPRKHERTEQPNQ